MKSGADVKEDHHAISEADCKSGNFWPSAERLTLAMILLSARKLLSSDRLTSITIKLLHDGP
jgi:hypothetical protein